MSSGFIEIAALGQQDVYLTGSPDVTYFSSVYKRHTPFVLEAFEVPFKASSITMGQNNIVRIPAKGDLIRATTLKLTLPPLSVYGQDWFWNEKPGSVLPTIIIDGITYYATIPSAGQYYSSNATAFAEWSASLGGKVIYDANLDKFVITATIYVTVIDPSGTGSLINSGVFWGFDPNNFNSRSGAGLRYSAKNGKVVPDFTLEQAGWARTIGEPINTLSGLFLKLNQTIDPEGYVNFSARNSSNLVWTNEDAPLAYVITPGGRINFTQAGLYMVRASFAASNGNGTLLLGSDANDGVPNTTNFWQTNINPVSTNTLIPYSIPIKVTDITQNWYVYIQGSSIGQGSYISVQPIDDYFGPSTLTPSGTIYNNFVGYAFDPNFLGQNGGAITVDGNGYFTFNQIGEWLISGIINTPALQDQGVTGLISSVQLIQGSNLLFTYDASGQLAESSSEFFIPVVVSATNISYHLFLNTVNGTSGKVLSTSFISFTYLALPNGGTSMYPTGGLILPLNGYFFDLGNQQFVNPLYFPDFTRYGVDNMVSLDGSGNVQFNNVGTYMMTTYFPLSQYNASYWDGTFNLNWDPTLAWPNMFLSNQNLTVTAFQSIATEPTMVLSSLFHSGTKLMFSVSMDYVVERIDYTAVGIGNQDLDTDSYLGADGNSIGYFESGNLYGGGYDGDPGPSFYTSNVVDVAVDTTSNMMMWIRVDGGEWTHNGGGVGGNPRDGIDGFDISSLNIGGDAYKFGVNVFYDRDALLPGQITFNTNSYYDVPVGFTFVPGVAGTNHVTNINSYSNVNRTDSYFENLGQSLVVDSNSSVYVLDPQNPPGGTVIAQVLADGESSIFAGYAVGTNPEGSIADGTGTSAILGGVECMAMDAYSNIYFGDYSTDKQGVIRVVSPGQVVRTLAGGGPFAPPYDSTGLNASFGRISAICVVGSNVVVNDDGYLRKLNLVTSQTQTYNDDDGWTQHIHQTLFYNVLASNNSRYIYAVNNSPTYITKIDTQSPIGDVYAGSPSFAGFFDSTRLNARFTNITCLYQAPTGLFICDSGRIRYMDMRNEATAPVYTLDSASFSFQSNPVNPVVVSSIIQFVVAPRSSADPFEEFHPEDVIYTVQTQVKTLAGTLSGTSQNALKMSENTLYPVTIPIRVDSAPMSYPVNIGHDDETFAPGAFVWVYPITSGILPPDYNQYHYYDSVGTWAIESADLKIGGQSIQTLSGEYIEIWNDLNVSYENQPALKLLTGKYDTTIATGRDYYVNLPFYFYEKSQNYLPMCSLSRQDVEIHVTFRTLQALTAIPVSEGNPVQATLIVEYVYLDTPELNWFTKTRLQYVIDQAQYQEIDLAAGLTQDNFLLNFRNPVNAMFFAIQVVGAVPYDWSNDGLERLGLSFNGEEIMLNRITDATQLGVIEPFNNFINFPTRNFYMKTFKSPINFSRIRYVLLGLNIFMSDAYYPAKQLRITAVSKNVLQINDGLGGLMFISQ